MSGTAHPARRFIGRTSAAALVVGLGLAAAPGPGLATDSGPASMGPAFAALSHGNQIIARALHEAQAHSGKDTATYWTLERIAAASAQGRAWDEVFETMHAAGLFKVNGLSELVFTYQKPRILKAAVDAREPKGGTDVPVPGGGAGTPDTGPNVVPGQADETGAGSSHAGSAGAAAAGFPTSGGGGVSGGHGHGRGR